MITRRCQRPEEIAAFRLPAAGVGNRGRHDFERPVDTAAVITEAITDRDVKTGRCITS
jgi:hypothetical protein